MSSPIPPALADTAALDAGGPTSTLIMAETLRVGWSVELEPPTGTREEAIYEQVGDELVYVGTHPVVIEGHLSRRDLNRHSNALEMAQTRRHKLKMAQRQTESLRGRVEDAQELVGARRFVPVVLDGGLS